MPTYQYQCDDCGHTFDTVQKFSDDPLTVCPNCGGAIRRVIGNVGVVFKGSGWYITDSRPKATDGAKAADDTKSGDAGKAADAPAADSRAAAKTESAGKSDVAAAKTPAAT